MGWWPENDGPLASQNVMQYNVPMAKHNYPAPEPEVYGALAESILHSVHGQMWHRVAEELAVKNSTSQWGTYDFAAKLIDFRETQSNPRRRDWESDAGFSTKKQVVRYNGTNRNGRVVTQTSVNVSDGRVRKNGVSFRYHVTLNTSYTWVSTDGTVLIPFDGDISKAVQHVAKKMRVESIEDLREAYDIIAAE